MLNQTFRSPRSCQPRTLVAAAGLAAVALAIPAHGQIKWSVVAMSGNSVPGAAAGVSFSATDLGLGGPSVNNGLDCGLFARLTGSGVTTSNDAGIYGGSPGGLGLVAREGDAAPETPAGVVFSSFLTVPQMGGSGVQAFRAAVSGPGVSPGINDEGVWTGTPGSLLLAGRTGSWAPGTGSTFASLGAPAVNGIGQLVFNGNTNEPVDNTGMWFGAVGSITVIAKQAAHADDLPANVNYSTFVTSSTAPSALINSAGQVAFRGTIVGPGVGGANNFCMWGGTPGSLHVVVREGMTRPDLPSGTWFLASEEPVLTDVGAMAFRGTLAGSGISAGNDVAVYRCYILGVLDEVAREGNGAPGLFTGNTFSNLSVTGGFGAPRMNNANQVAFRAQVAGPAVTAASDTGIWAHNDIGALVLVAREGDAALGTPAGTVWTGFDAASPVINNKGQVAFLATLSGGLGSGIWATDPYGVMHLVARNGMAVEVAEGDVKTFTFLRAITGRGIQDGTSTGFNDDGRLMVRADYGTGTGIFLADINDQCKPVFADQPDDAAAAPGDDISFDVVTTGPGAHTYQWRRDGVVLSDGFSIGHGFVGGSTTASLNITSITGADGGDYECLVTNRCRTVTSAAASLTVGSPCGSPDFDGDGDTGTDADIEAFFACLGGSCCGTCGSADFDGDGDSGTDLDIEAFFRVLGGGSC